MPYTKVSGTVSLPYYVNGVKTPIKSGRVIYRRNTAVPIDGDMTPNLLYLDAPITNGVIEERELSNGLWVATIESDDASVATFYVRFMVKDQISIDLGKVAPIPDTKMSMYSQGEPGIGIHGVTKSTDGVSLIITLTDGHVLDPLPLPEGVGILSIEADGLTDMLITLDNGTVKRLTMPVGPRGPRGESNYDIAKRYGYKGTEESWYNAQANAKGTVQVTDDGRGGLYIDGSAVTVDDKGAVVVYDGIEPLASTWSTNPLAARQNTYITSLTYDAQTNRIFSGYGDWTKNGDEIGIVSHDILTGVARIEYFPDKGKNTIRPDFGRAGLYTEAVEVFYRNPENHAMYVPHTDGAGYWDGCGYASDENGEWKEYTVPGQAIHIFSAAQTSQGLWMAGSGITPDQEYATPQLWFRPNGGEWYVAYQEPVIARSYNDNSRYYTMTVIEDRVWVCTSNTYSVDKATVRGFKFIPKSDGTRWDNPLPAEALDMQTREYASSDAWMTYYAPPNTVVVGDFRYIGQSNGKIKKEVLR